MQGPVRGAILTVEQRLAAVEGRLASLEKLLLVANDGSLTIKSTTKLSLQAPNVEVKSGTSMRIDGGANIDLKAGAQLNLNAAGVASLKAATVTLNGGTKPIARVGDAISGSVIGVGSPTVLG